MLERLLSSPKTDLLTGKRVLITGCGYKLQSTIFTDIVTGNPTHDAIEFNGKPVKLNIGSAVAGVLARNGAIVHMVSTSPDKLRTDLVRFSF